MSTGRSSSFSGPVAVEDAVGLGVAVAVAVAVAVSPSRGTPRAAMAGASSSSEGDSEGEGEADGEGRRGGSSPAGNGDAVRGVTGGITGSAAMVVSQGEGREACDAGDVDVSVDVDGGLQACTWTVGSRWVGSRPR